MISRKKIILKSEDFNNKEKRKNTDVQNDSSEDLFKDSEIQDLENTWFSLDQLLNVSINCNCN